MIFQFCDIMMAHGHCRHPKFEVVLSLIMGRRFSRHQRPHILSCIIHGVALYAGICGMSTCEVDLNVHQGHRFNKKNVSNVYLKDLLNYNFISLFIQIFKDKTRDTG